MTGHGLATGTPGPAALRDGRVRRRERNREAILEALREILASGHLEPTAEEIAARAGVQARTLFRHFPDMATLHGELGSRFRAELVPLLAGLGPGGTPAERLSRLVGARATVFERIAPFKRAGNVQRWRVAFLQQHHERLVRELRRHLLHVVPEVRDRPPAVVAALEMVTSFEAWDRLRTEQRLGPERAREAMERAAIAILGSETGRGHGPS